MPELPEVETVARGLAYLSGKKLRALEIYDARVWFESELDPEGLSGLKLETIARRGKYILLRFEKNLTLVQHLRMTGKMLEARSSAIPAPVSDALGAGGKGLQIRCRFLFSGHELWFFDTRRFGTLTLTRNEEEYFRRKKIAPDPFHEPEQAFAWFREKLSKTGKPVKSALLDQAIVAGVGNIYADEALHRAGIHPLTKANKISSPETLWQEIVKLLARSIELGGSTIRDYVSASGEAGTFASEHLVYGRAGEKCRTCGSPIQRIVLGGRATHFCAKCQPQPWLSSGGKKRPIQGGSLRGQPRSAPKGISAKLIVRSRSKRKSPR
jgi:formamidopyrimidine-DNA glycosylase